MALAVIRDGSRRATSQVGGGSAFFVRPTARHEHHQLQTFDGVIGHWTYRVTRTGLAAQLEAAHGIVGHERE